MKSIGAGLAVVVVGLLGGHPATAQRSIEDAVKVIESFRGDTKGAAATPVSFVPPPRTIQDITAILDQQKPDPAKRAASIAFADAEPAAGLAGPELADFYYRRSQVAGEIGRAQQSLADATQAYEIGRGLPNFQPARLTFYVQGMMFAQNALGNMRGVIQAAQVRLDIAGRLDGVSRITGMLNANVSIATAAAKNGQLDMARDAVAKMERLIEDFPQRAPPGLRDVMRTIVLRGRGLVAAETGRYSEAEALLRQGVALTLPQIGKESMMGMAPGLITESLNVVYGDLVRTMLRQGRLTEAEADARRVLLSRLSISGRYAASTANAIAALSRVVSEQGRYAEAEKLADAARDIFENLGHGKGSFSLANARRQLASAQSSQDKFAEAGATFAKLAEDADGNAELQRAMLDSNPDYARVLLHAGRAADALRITQNVVEINEKNLGDKAFATAQARGWHAVAQTRAGQGDKALAGFEAAAAILTSSSRGSEDGDDDGSSVGQRDRQTQQIIEAYLGLLADTKGAVAAVPSFALADAVRGQSVQRALAASSARATASDPTLANFARLEQDAQKQAAALQGLLTNILSKPTGEQDATGVQKLREDIDKLRSARARVREEIERRFPDYANLIDPRPATVEQAQKSLRPGEALIATYAGDERLFVWAIPHQGAPAYASSKVTDREIERMVTQLRKSLDPNATTLDEVPAFDVATAHKLYTLLLKPVEAGWTAAQSLLIVPHKALGQLPVALLVTDNVPQPAKAGTMFAEYKNVSFLIRKTAVTQLPSVASLATLRALPAPKGERISLVAFGDPWFSPEQAAEAKAERQQTAQAGLQTRGKLIRRSAPKTDGVDSAELALLPRLPDTAEEVRSIALALKADLAKDVFTGADANEKAVKTMNLSNRKVIMFATHGLVPGDLNGLTQPALALSAPKVAGVDGDGLLTMEEVLALKLNADWVVLSACNTATGSGAGAEAVSGLGRAFFYAGTRALLVSNWPVETVSARTLTTDLFRRQAENPNLARGEAMRQAELALIDGPGAGEFSYAHPIFWAPFTVVGDGGAS